MGDKSQDILRERTNVQKAVEGWDATDKDIEDLLILIELSEDDEGDEDDGVAEELGTVLPALIATVENMEFTRMLSGEHDANNAILSINAGAGGTEAQDWASMLMRMYLRYCEKKGFKTEITEYLDGEEAGIKSITFTVQGEYAYGFLRAENGIHRLVRISPYDSNARRHTSFASVFLFPELDDDVDIEILDKDLKIDTFRASGAGGQHINKTDSAIRITHMPSGVVVACQSQRSQHKNKAQAMKQLKARLYELERQRMADENDELAGDKKEIGWGSQIRSYVLHPYRMVKDHRTNYETGNTDAVLDGDLEAFIEAYLLSASESSD